MEWWFPSRSSWGRFGRGEGWALHRSGQERQVWVLLQKGQLQRTTKYYILDLGNKGF